MPDPERSDNVEPPLNPREDVYPPHSQSINVTDGDVEREKIENAHASGELAADPDEVEDVGKRAIVGEVTQIPVQAVVSPEFNPPVANHNGGMEFVESEEGARIPVRKVNGYDTYTDDKGRQLQTEEYVGPGSEQVGKKYEHDPSRAHDMAADSNLEHKLAASFREDAEQYTALGDRASANRASLFAAGNEERAESREERVGLDYDIEHGLPVPEEKVRAREQELFSAMGVLTENLRETIEELASLRKKYPNKIEEPSAEERVANVPEATDHQAWVEEQRRTWSN